MAQRASQVCRAGRLDAAGAWQAVAGGDHAPDGEVGMLETSAVPRHPMPRPGLRGQLRCQCPRLEGRPGLGTRRVAVDSGYASRPFVEGVRELALHTVGRLRHDAILRKP